MIVYHGSDVIVEKPVLLAPKRTLDFGAGFYTTTNKKQAVGFAHKVMLRNDSQTRAVSVYEVDFYKIENSLEVLKFDAPDAGWLDFVFANRQGIYKRKQYDVVIGAVADDTIYRVISLYEAGILTLDSRQTHNEG
ncbi:DUF3990 domain-containing protein [Metallumcola ferriviriculae]|uniref:DUF3990 domain-containing protein n=1 Tax=Metallumcola ferriviriculae TaxID=3039180 RepID=A0AAU0UNG4_9FIRM|nr:DUF3990 domain-containing protein [Desulfitibacteraceae bacterium MK1]